MNKKVRKREKKGDKETGAEPGKEKVKERKEKKKKRMANNDFTGTNDKKWQTRRVGAATRKQTNQ